MGLHFRIEAQHYFASRHLQNAPNGLDNFGRKEIKTENLRLPYVCFILKGN